MDCSPWKSVWQAWPSAETIQGWLTAYPVEVKYLRHKQQQRQPAVFLASYPATDAVTPHSRGLSTVRQTVIDKRSLLQVGLGMALVAGVGAAAWFLRRQILASRQPAGRAIGEALPGSERERAARPTGQILIPVANPATARPLVHLASILSDAELVTLKVITPGKGSTLEQVRRYQVSIHEQFSDALAEATHWAEEQGVPLRAELVVARDVPGGILEFARGLSNLQLILLGWQGAMGLRKMHRSVNQDIFSRAHTHVAVLRERNLGPIRKILIPVGWGPHVRLGLRLAEGMARRTHAQVTVLRVLPMTGEVDWEGERAALVNLLTEEAPSLRYDTELRLAREPGVVSAILAEAEREHYDLLIIGASNEWWVRSWLFGAIPDRIAEQAPCSVLLVRRYDPAAAI